MPRAATRTTRPRTAAPPQAPPVATPATLATRVHDWATWNGILSAPEFVARSAPPLDPLREVELENGRIAVDGCDCEECTSVRTASENGSPIRRTGRGGRSRPRGENQYADTAPVRRRNEDEDNNWDDDDDDRDSPNIRGYHSSHGVTRCIRNAWSKAHGERYLGVELEVERHRGSDYTADDIAAEVLAVANASREELFAEGDGSLTDGFEMVTQPMGLDDQRALWTRILSGSYVARLRSHDTSTCGLHVHVSRKGLSALTIAKAVCFLNDDKTMPFIKLLARRYDTGYCKKKHVDTKRLSEASYSGDRYEMLNLTCANTVEFRMFKGSLRLETVLASIESCHAILEWCSATPVKELTVAGFLRWISEPAQMRDTRNLRAYLKTRTDAGRTLSNLGQDEREAMTRMLSRVAKADARANTTPTVTVSHTPASEA